MPGYWHDRHHRASNHELTGVQWLADVTTLNFITAKEGYTGTGWDVNVLNRANEIGHNRRSGETGPSPHQAWPGVLYNADQVSGCLKYGQ